VTVRSQLDIPRHPSRPLTDPLTHLPVHDAYSSLQRSLRALCAASWTWTGHDEAHHSPTHWPTHSHFSQWLLQSSLRALCAASWT
jgi:hypothetical protein